MNAPAASILVVDDEPDLRTLYELTLLREGYRVETASNVQEAQRKQLKAQRFDAVITDMRLPDGFGMELLQDLRDQQRRERCVVMTAYGSAENAVEALRAGAFDLPHQARGPQAVPLGGGLRPSRGTGGVPLRVRHAATAPAALPMRSGGQRIRQCQRRPGSPGGRVRRHPQRQTARGQGVARHGARADPW